MEINNDKAMDVGKNNLKQGKKEDIQWLEGKVPHDTKLNLLDLKS